MLDKLKKMLVAKEEERQALVEKSEKSNDVNEVRSIHTDLEKINADIKELRSMIDAAENADDNELDERSEALLTNENIETRSFMPGIGFRKIDGGNFTISEREKEKEEYEKRGKELKENRAVTVGASGIILPNHQATDIKGTFNQVSTLVDAVNNKPMNGGESYKQPYVKGYGTADYTGEEEGATATEPKFGYAEITKAKITAYAEITEELEKLPAAAYAMEVQKAIRIALRKKIAAEILVGDGSTNHLMGIVNSETIETSNDTTITTIDDKTLDEIIFSYGGDEDVEDSAVLILNKKDLKGFAQLRSKDGKKVHAIVAHGNTGTIDGINYIISSKCKSILDEKTVAGDFCMAYGSMSQYDLVTFSDIEVKKSTDYRFKEGMTAYRGSVILGGNVVSHNGFLRVKKAGASV